MVQTANLKWMTDIGKIADFKYKAPGIEAYFTIEKYYTEPIWVLVYLKNYPLKMTKSVVENFA